MLATHACACSNDAALDTVPPWCFGSFEGRNETRGPRHGGPSAYFAWLIRSSAPSCAPGERHLTELSTNDTPVVATRPSRPSVTASAVAAHLAMTRQNVVKLAHVDHLFERLPDGRFDLDACRFAYLKWLRDPARRSARSEAAAEHAKAKTELLQIRIMERQRKLVRREDVNELIDELAGTVLTHLSGMAARCSRDLVVRRNIDAVVLQVQREMAAACLAMTSGTTVVARSSVLVGIAVAHLVAPPDVGIEAITLKQPNLGCASSASIINNVPDCPDCCPIGLSHPARFTG
jgi:hypothetical protein